MDQLRFPDMITCDKPNNIDKISSVEHQCEHYKRNCKYVAKCCGNIYHCRKCHDDNENHEINRYETEQMICLNCNAKVQIGKYCSDCGFMPAKYYCDICKFHDNSDKEIYHCEKCNICRIGKLADDIDGFKHCDKCNLCIHVSIFNNHRCIDNNANSQCPICLDDISTSTESFEILSRCGHLIHTDCLKQYVAQNEYKCPLCKKSLVNMAESWALIDEAIYTQPMPPYERKIVSINCADCDQSSDTSFHWIGNKCMNCGSYNTTLN